MIYCYSTADRKKTIERCYSPDSFPRRIRENGETFYLDVAAQQAGVGGVKNHAGGVWQRSLSNGCLPHTIPRRMEEDARVGAPAIEYDRKTGHALFEGPGQKNNWLRAHKRVDYDAGYNAPVPGDFLEK